MTYRELREKQQKEFDQFPLGAAFSEKQFNEMMEKWGLKPTDTDKIYSIGSGCYIRKSDSSLLDELWTRHSAERKQEIENDLTGEGYVYQMFAYELANHEYGYTRDLTDTLEALNLTEEQIEKDKKLMRGLKKALKEYKGRY